MHSIKKVIKTNLMADISLLHFKTFEYKKVIRETLKAKEELGFDKVLLWKRGEGLVDIENESEIFGNFKDVLDEEKVNTKTIIILKDIHRIYEDPSLLLSIQKIMEASSKGEIPINLIGLSPSSKIPEEIERFTQIDTISLPEKADILEQIESQFIEYGVFLGKSILNKLTNSLTGLMEDEITTLINIIIVTSFRDKTNIDENILGIIQEQKKQQIKKSGILEFITPNVTIDDIGGLPNLKLWLRERKDIFDDPERAMLNGVKVPKGILLFGMPGSGKSLTAKVSANYFKIPLLRVDMGLIYGQKSPEEAVGRMIALADAISPCVLWIDEIEKALAGSGNNETSDVSIKILGILLTWMQERTKPVFIVATANDISSIRPETYRDGRLDEKFMLDFLKEDTEQIEQIIDIHLKTRLKENHENIVRYLDYKAINKKMLSKVKATGCEKSAGYTGANMEALVEKVLHDRYINRKPYIDTKDFVRLLNDVSPQKGIAIKEMLYRAGKMDAVVA